MREVHIGTCEHDLRSSAPHLLYRIISPRQCGHHTAGCGRGFQAFVDVAAQNRVWADLNENVNPHLPYLTDGFFEKHRLADVVPPVAGVELRALHDFTRDGRHEIKQRLLWRNCMKCLLKPRLDRVHRCAVKGVVKVKSFVDDLTFRQDRFQLGQCARWASQADASPTVDASDGHAVGKAGIFKQHLHLHDAQCNGCHLALAFGQALKMAAVINDFDGLFKCQGTSSPGRCYFAHAVSGHNVWLQSLGAQHLSHANLNREQCRLCDFCSVVATLPVFAIELFFKRKVFVFFKETFNRLNGCFKSGILDQ